MINLNPSAQQVRQFSRLWLPLFGVFVGGLQWYRGAAFPLVAAIWIATAALTVGAVASPVVGRRLFVTLLWITAPIGFVVGTTLMAFIYFVVLTPLAAVRRAGRRDLLRLRREPEAQSYWEARAPRPGVDHHFSQF